MSFRESLKPIFTREGILLVSVALTGGLIWVLHFILEFSILQKLTPTGQPFNPIFILPHIGLVPIGCLFYLMISSRWSPFKALLPSVTIITLSFILILILPNLGPIQTTSFTLDPVFILYMILLAVAGFFIGTILAPLMLISKPYLKNVEYNGRIYSFATAFLSPIVIIATWLHGMNQPLLLSAYFIVVYIVIALLFIDGKKKLNNLPPRCTNIRSFLRHKDVWPSILLMFFVGFFFTNTYLASVILLDYSNILSNLDTFVIVLFSVCIIVTIPCGMLFDRIGRRWTLLIGFYAQAIAFLLLSFFPPMEYPFMLEVIFPAVIAFGFTIAIFGALLVSLELAPRGFLRVHQGISWVLFGVGMTVGVITDIALYPLITTSPAYLPLVLIFALFTATIVVLQLKETLPSKEELEWKRKLEHILVLTKGGIPLYSERMSPTQPSKESPDEMLIGGALTGITELIKEISQRAGKLKVIQQEGYCIILEEGREVIVAVMALEELGTIRAKTQDFLEDFQRFFGELINDWSGDPKVFSPAKELVQNHFY
ncbi:MAG: hypothetical protein GF411_03640 [Candidatus Lokiarchaeota archaeon]|nr:hypothetical protein [Candidatus Lokiarchaeota archaeon]